MTSDEDREAKIRVRLKMANTSYNGALIQDAKFVITLLDAARARLDAGLELETERDSLQELVKEAFGIMDSREYVKSWVVKAVDALSLKVE